MLVAACGREPEAQQEVAAPDACDLIRLSDAELAKKTREAQRGDVTAEKSLWHHYGCTDKRKAAYWEERLVQQGDRDAMGVRASKLFSAADKLEDNDPRKLAMLDQSLVLEAKERRADAGRVDKVLVNGQWVEVRYTGEPDQGTRNMQAERDRVAALQGKR